VFFVKRLAATCRTAREKEKGVSRSRLGRAGDGARELLPWTAGPGAQKNFDPEHPLARGSKGISRLALVLYSIQFLLCLPSLALSLRAPLLRASDGVPMFRLFIANAKGTFFGMSESLEESSRR